MSHIVIVIDTDDRLHRLRTQEALESQFMAGRDLHYQVNGSDLVIPIDASRVTVQDDADEVTVYQDKADEFRWRRVATGNHEPISSGEGYTRRPDVERGALRANPDLSSESFFVDGEQVEG